MVLPVAETLAVSCSTLPVTLHYSYSLTMLAFVIFWKYATCSDKYSSI